MPLFKLYSVDDKFDEERTNESSLTLNLACMENWKLVSQTMNKSCNNQANVGVTSNSLVTVTTKFIPSYKLQKRLNYYL